MSNGETSSNKGFGVKLQKAALSGDTNQIEMLLKAGAPVDGTDPNGRTALHWAAGWSPLAIMNLLIERCGPDTINLKDSEGRTALHLAAMQGHREVVEILSAKGGKINIRDGEGYTPLHLAAGLGRNNMVRMLLDCGADPNMRTSDDMTSLHLAALYGTRGTVEALMDHGAKKDVTDSLGKKPLDYAREAGDSRIIEYLTSK